MADLEGVALSERAAGASHGYRLALGTVMAQWKFRFDGAYSGNFYRVDSPLGVTFSRAVATVDPSGASVISNKPRFDRATHIAPVGDPTGIAIGDDGAAPESRLLAAGVAADGTTPLMVFRDEDHGKLFVLSGSTLSEVLRTSLTTVSLVNVQGNNPSEAAGFTPSGLSSDYVLVPSSAVVVHGLVVLAGMLVKEVGTTSTYEIVGWGFAQLTKPDDDFVWTHLWNDASIGDNQPNFYRGREWCLHASLAHARGDAHPLTCWISSTDYRYQAFTAYPAHEPLTLGGRVFVLKFKRTTENDPWEWETESGDPFYSDIEPGNGDIATGCHAHSCQIAEYGNNGIQMVASVGDAQYHSRFICYRLADLAEDYSDPDNWTWTSGGYHGFRQQGGLPDPLLGSRSQQPVGVALGPRARLAQPFSNSVSLNYRSTLIWGTDEQAEVITRMVLPEPTEVQNGTDQLWIEHLHGFTTGFGSEYGASFSRLRGIVFCLAQSSAESGSGSLVAVLSNASDDDGGDPPERLAITRLLYCPDQSHPDRWMQVFSTWGESEGTAVLYGDRVYFNSYSQLDGNGGLQYIPIPTDTTVFKPIIVAPGGKNLAIEGCAKDIGEQGSNGIVQLTKNAAGKWEDTLPNGITKRSLPPPPSITSEVYRIRTWRSVPGTTDKFICRVRVSGQSAGNWNELAPGQGWSTGTKVRRIRCWVLDGTWGVLTGSNSQSSPNKSAQMSMRTRTGLDTNVDPPIVQGAPLLFSCSNRWCPLTIIGVRTITNDPSNHLTEGIAIELLCASDTNSPIFPPDDNYLYLAIDGAFDGNGSLPYPVALSEVDSTPITNPDELLTLTIGTTSGVSPLSLTHDWTLRLAGQVPIGNWDQYAERRDSNGLDARYWPLFTLWADNSNWIEFSANCTDMGFRVRVCADGETQTPEDFGTADQLWLPDSTLMAAVSWDWDPSNGGKLYFGASLAAGEVAVGPPTGLTISWPSGITAFTQLRFRGAPDIEDEVCEFRWFGGDVTDAASNNDVLANGAFDSIAFAKGPTT